MRIENFEEVNKLLKIRENCVRALEQAKSGSWGVVDSGGIDGFEAGYFANFCKHNGGSGDVVDMNGCYVADQVAEAIVEILEDQIRNVETRLLQLLRRHLIG